MQSNILKEFVVNIINNIRGQDIICFDMYGKTNITDVMIICTGMSSRHVISISQEILKKSRGIGVRPYGIEGMNFGEWVLVDLGDVVIHVMQKEIRTLYELEKLWC
ncbi:ribosome silencing factor [Blochmannia endosymbiont of Camponotus sp.]|uniref:ribosome silencing factor n=1 Tax=Blochmannia endosymbiont of Camponotus sp. TaxID=700220 RepID=UPI00202512E9|nr:ribosome silencing factor [Blochmannia endosymbiont of Camponotus sp.]URJ30071.1 ribosome silencing factor [Blochmannia endosymbiont of Camponotus sp.]URJ31034.1 ribosome silencing factor [Blochmannia endosymbiont of Camponotus sp.]